jgi:hypothetical protein
VAHADQVIPAGLGEGELLAVLGAAGLAPQPVQFVANQADARLIHVQQAHPLRRPRALLGDERTWAVRAAMRRWPR